MKALYEKLDDNFNEISNLINEVSILNLSKIKERILEITEDKSLISQIRQLEKDEDISEKKRKPILLTNIKEEENNKLKEQIKNLEEENKQLKNKLLKAKSNKAVGRKEKLSAKKKEEIREIYNDNEMSMPQLAKKYKVSVGLIHKIINEKR